MAILSGVTFNRMTVEAVFYSGGADGAKAENSALAQHFHRHATP
jgi:hypothetical protein